MIHDKTLTSSLERRKTFDSPLANHFSAAMQGCQIGEAMLMNSDQNEMVLARS
jgi:hypothetical protein